MSIEAISTEIAAIHRENEKRDDEIAALRGDIKQLLELANKGKGGFWVGMTVASMLGAASSWILGHIRL